MGDQNWRTSTNSADYFGQQKKQLNVADRRPVIRRASDLVGPGIAATAVQITDFNDLLATYNGFFSSEAGALNAPSGFQAFVGTVVSDAEIGGRQTFTGVDTEEVYQRVFRRNPGDSATIYWGDWVIAGSGGGGGSGVVVTIVEGDHIDVDDTDPANPIVTAVGFLETETLPESIIDAEGDLIVGTAADTAVRLPVGSEANTLTVNDSGMVYYPERSVPTLLFEASEDDTDVAATSPPHGSIIKFKAP